MEELPAADSCSRSVLSPVNFDTFHCLLKRSLIYEAWAFRQMTILNTSRKILRKKIQYSNHHVLTLLYDSLIRHHHKWISSIFCLFLLALTNRFPIDRPSIFLLTTNTSKWASTVQFHSMKSSCNYTRHHS